MYPKRKHIRLDPTCYAYHSNPCSITLAVKERKEVFGLQHNAFTQEALSIVKQIVQKKSIPLHIILFMPDHVHLCVEASPRVSIIDFIKEMKSRIVILALRYGHTHSFWQTSFFDHFLRKDENIKTVAQYILHNPCRKNIVDLWEKYPYWYSNEYSKEQLMDEV